MNSNIGWTAQSKDGYVHDDGMPGNVIQEHELPDPEVQRAAGINPDLYRGMHGLVVEPSDKEAAPFTSTETGSKAHEVIRKTGNIESFQSEPEEYGERHYVSQTVGASTDGMDYPRSATGHILYDPSAQTFDARLLPQFREPVYETVEEDSNEE